MYKHLITQRNTHNNKDTQKHEHMKPYEDEYLKMRNKGFNLKETYDGIRVKLLIFNVN